MSLRIFALVYMACFAASSMGLYLVKYSVQNIQRDVASLKTELAAEKESLHLLNAEWAYLNRPDRLQKLAERHLDLVPLDSRRIENTALLPAASRSDDDTPRAIYQPVSQHGEAQ
jgi:cell division protein FtsL